MPDMTMPMGPQFIHLQWFAEEGGEAGNPGQGSGEGAQPAGSFATNLAKKEAGSDGEGASPQPAQEPAKGKPAEKAEGGKEKPTTELPGWTNATTKELRADPRFAAFASKFKSFDDAVKSAIELEAKIGGMVSLPGKDSKPEEIAEFYSKFGVPEKPEGYDLKKHEDLDYSDEDLNEFKGLAHKLHLTKDQAAAMFDLVNERAVQELEAYAAKKQQESEEAITGCESTLKKEWGASFDGNLAVARRGIAAYADTELMNDAAATGMGNSPAFLKLFYRLGQLTREDSTAHRAPGGRGTEKPLEDIMYPAKKA